MWQAIAGMVAAPIIQGITQKLFADDDSGGYTNSTESWSPEMQQMYRNFLDQINSGSIGEIGDKYESIFGRMGAALEQPLNAQIGGIPLRRASRGALSTAADIYGKGFGAAMTEPETMLKMISTMSNTNMMRDNVNPTLGQEIVGNIPFDDMIKEILANYVNKPAQRSGGDLWAQPFHMPAGGPGGTEYNPRPSVLTPWGGR